MKSSLQHINLETKKQFELVDITASVKAAISESRVTSGIAMITNPHTTAAIRVTQNEPLLMQDIMKMLYRLIPLDTSYSHDLFEVREQVAVNERSNGHAHVKSFLLGASESFIVEDGKILLGEKQSIFFVELDGGRTRNYYVKVMGND